MTTYKKHILAVLLAALLSIPAFAAENRFVGSNITEGNWGDDIWSTGDSTLAGTAVAPTSADNLYVRNGKILNLNNGGDYTVLNLLVANTATNGAGTFNITNGTLRTGTASVTQIGGAGSSTSAPLGTVTVGPNGVFYVNNVLGVGNADYGNGKLEIQGGSVIMAGSEIRVANGSATGTSSAKGIITISGGGLLDNASGLAKIGQYGNGTLELLNGTMNATTVRIYSQGTITFGGNANFNVTATGTADSSGLRINAGTLKFQVADANFKTVTMGASSITINTDSTITADLTGFDSVSFDANGEIKLTLMLFSTTATNSYGSSFTLEAVNWDTSLYSDAKVSWIYDTDNTKRLGIQLTVTAAIPEPSTYALIAVLGAMVLVIHRRRKQ